MTEGLLLRPAKARGSLLLGDASQEPVQMEWAALVERLAPDRSVSSKLTIRTAKIGDFIGVREKGGRLVNFLVLGTSGECNIGWLLKKIPDFCDSIKEIYRVEQVSWGAKMVESAA